MQTYKKNLVIFIIIVLTGSCFAQTIEMPEMPSMPETSYPTLGDGFYTPTIPANPVLPKNNSSTKTETAVQDKTVQDKASTQKTDLLSLLSGTSSGILSASDISSLYDSGLFGNISSLSNINSNDTATNLILQQILTSLEELKNEKNNATPAQKELYEQKEADTKSFNNRTLSVLRFKINGYNVKDSLTSVFFSETETDGSFMFTADRKYFTQQKYRYETFYLLFKARKSNGSSTVFDVVPIIAQDSENTNSVVYKLSQRKDLTAEKVGNLVVLNSSEGDLQVDLLLDVDD